MSIISFIVESLHRCMCFNKEHKYDNMMSPYDDVDSLTWVPKRNKYYETSYEHPEKTYYLSERNAIIIVLLTIILLLSF